MKYLKIFPAGLTDSFTNLLTKSDSVLPPPLVETCTLTRGGGKDSYFGQNRRIFGLLGEKTLKNFRRRRKNAS